MLRRPNGRPQACEPCRKRKVACDHTQPICRRCTKRKQQRECVYIPSEKPRAQSIRSHTEIRTASPTPQRDQPPSPAQYIHASLEPPTATGERTPTTAPVSTGYLGFTSFFSVYEETGSILQTPALTSPVAHHSTRAADIPIPLNLPPKVLDACLTILGNIPEPAKGVDQFRRFAAPFDTFSHVVAKRILHSLYDKLGQYLGHERNPRHLELVARKLCINTARPFSETESDPDRWIDQFTGDNLRWESLGILFAFWDLYVEDADTPRYNYRHMSKFKSREPVTRDSLRCCLEVCAEFSTGNSLLLYISHKHTVAESMISGDASLRTWRTHSETIALLTFLGLHVELDSSTYEPTLASEFRRTLFACCYSMDMVIVSFTGRPPLISSRYCSTPLPLDLSHEELLQNKGSIAQAVQCLDENGWKSQPAINSPAFYRARAMLALIREDVFRIALSYRQGVSLDALLEIKAKEIRTYSQLPSIFHCRASDLADHNIDPASLYTRLILRLEHLQNIFFVERLLLRHGKVDRTDILAASFEMLSDTLPFWTHLDRLAPMRDDCEWLVMAYAAPAGGILCLELLKPTLHSSHQSNPEITRSSIIQKLSLLVGFLDWVKPCAPNSDLCASCSIAIQHVLDRVLNPVAYGEDVPDTSEWDLGTQLDFNFDLLDTFDWLRPDAD